MRAVEISRYGGPEVLQLKSIPAPKLKSHEVLIRIAASGVNFIDLYVREGRYAHTLPLVPGQEAAGTVAEVGSDVSHLKIGDRVAWCSITGTYAEFAVAPANRVVTIPEALTFEQAAAAMLQGMTAHYLSHAAYAIQPGDEILIHAGAGGTGLLLTQFAKARGAKVFTTVSTGSKAALSREAGADEVIRYDQTDFVVEVNRITSNRRLAAVYDSIGESTFERSLASLRRRGTLVLYGSAGGDVPLFDVSRLATMGSLFVTRPVLRDYTLTREELVMRSSAVFASIERGELQVRIASYPLSEAEQAHRDLEGRMTTGKALLLP